jgi:hypothetical protein
VNHFKYLALVGWVQVRDILHTLLYLTLYNQVLTHHILFDKQNIDQAHKIPKFYPQ